MNLFRWQTKSNKETQVHIRPTVSSDWPAIEGLLSYANHEYAALEWWTLQERLGHPTFLLATDLHELAVGLILVIADDGPIAWIRAISVTSNMYLPALLKAAISTVQAQGCTGIAFLGDDGWIVSKLKLTGFQQNTRVITLQRRGTWKRQNGPLNLEVRTVTPADISAVHSVDRIAFSPMWQYSREILTRAMSLAYCFDVAYLDGECVGYQLGTLRSRRGHIVRLAVHPKLQRQGIGGRLLSEAIQSFDQASAQILTVNTQENNQDSLRLYRRFSFERIGKPWTVWFRSLMVQ